MSPPAPQLIFGSGLTGSQLGEFSTAQSVQNLLDTLHDLGYRRLDVSSRHPPGSDHLAETLVGAAHHGRFILDFKSHLKGTDPTGSMATSAVRSSVAGSLQRLGIEKANVFYCYAPDKATPLEVQVAAVDEQYRKGAFDKFGLSNFPPELIEKWISICEEKGHVKPTVYQGNYNLVSRRSEARLVPLLRKHGMSYVAYSPLAAGFLTAKFTTGRAEGTRFDPAHPFSSFALGIYDKPEFHRAVERLLDGLKGRDMSAAEAALRWICFHSVLGEGDGVIMGASRIEQVKQSSEFIAKGPLPEEVVQVIEEVWKTLSSE